jgi:hypothetical protein
MFQSVSDTYIHYTACKGVPPLALLCVGKEGTHEFKDIYKDVYKYEVLGGLHSVTTRKQILSDDPGM